MSYEFDRSPRDAENQSPSNPRRGLRLDDTRKNDTPPGDASKNRSSAQEFEPDSFETPEPNEPPRGLMHKRRHPLVWIGLALLLGGLIALILAALVTG